MYTVKDRRNSLNETFDVNLSDLHQILSHLKDEPEARLEMLSFPLVMKLPLLLLPPPPPTTQYLFLLMCQFSKAYNSLISMHPLSI